jgi:hypothetical protein
MRNRAACRSILPARESSTMRSTSTLAVSGSPPSPAARWTRHDATDDYETLYDQPPQQCAAGDEPNPLFRVPKRSPAWPSSRASG